MFNSTDSHWLCWWFLFCCGPNAFSVLPGWMSSERKKRQSVFCLFYPRGSSNWFCTTRLNHQTAFPVIPSSSWALQTWNINNMSVWVSLLENYSTPWAWMVVFSWVEIKGAKDSNHIIQSYRGDEETQHTSLLCSPWLKVTRFDALGTLCDHTQVSVHVSVLMCVCRWYLTTPTGNIKESQKEIAFWWRVSSASVWLCPLPGCLLVFSFTSVEPPPCRPPLFRLLLCQFPAWNVGRSGSSCQK